MFSSAAFFGSGHQNTIPSVRYPAAYIGFHGSINEMIPQGIKNINFESWLIPIQEDAVQEFGFLDMTVLTWI